MINEEWKWVPVEPTKDMIEAAFKKTTIGYGWIPVHYRAMLAAAPTLLITDENTSQERVRSEAENKYEPVAWRYWNEKSRSWNSTNSAVVAQVLGESGRVVEPLYLHPPPPHMPEPMTEAEVGAVMNEVERTCEYGHHHFGYWLAVSRAIEAETLRRVRGVNNG